MAKRVTTEEIYDFVGAMRREVLKGVIAQLDNGGYTNETAKRIDLNNVAFVRSWLKENGIEVVDQLTKEAE